MAFQRKNLAPLGNMGKPITSVAAGLTSPGAPKMWSYVTEDAVATVRAAGYFNEVRDLMQIGDLIYVVVVAAGALGTASLIVLKDKSSTVVDTTDATVLTVADTD